MYIEKEGATSFSPPPPIALCVFVTARLPFPAACTIRQIHYPWSARHYPGLPVYSITWSTFSIPLVATQRIVLAATLRNYVIW